MKLSTEQFNYLLNCDYSAQSRIYALSESIIDHLVENLSVGIWGYSAELPTDQPGVANAIEWDQASPTYYKIHFANDEIVLYTSVKFIRSVDPETDIINYDDETNPYQVVSAKEFVYGCSEHDGCSKKSVLIWVGDSIEEATVARFLGAR